MLYTPSNYLFTSHRTTIYSEMIYFVNFVTLALALSSSVVAFPAHGSLAGLSRAEVDAIMPTLQHQLAPPPPPKIAFNGTKLVNYGEHSYQAPKPTDQRGPCPGLNTLANHGYIPRNGIATPGELVSGVQEGLNMEYHEALSTVYSAFLLDGNLVTNLISIGSKSSLTGGPDPPPPAQAAGLDIHNLFEGDASMSRTDAYFGNPIHFNETVFSEFINFSNMYGAGKYNYTVAGKLRWQRVQDGIATNPEFSYLPLIYRTSHLASGAPVNFFIDGRHEDGQLDLDVARMFFETNQMPDGFYRASMPMSSQGMDVILAQAPEPIIPGKNTNGVNTYVQVPNPSTFTSDPNGCLLYHYYVNETIIPLYPNPDPVLREAISRNLGYLFSAISGECEQVFPFGQP